MALIIGSLYLCIIKHTCHRLVLGPRFAVTFLHWLVSQKNLAGGHHGNEHYDASLVPP